METLDAIKTRRSCRSFSEVQIKDEELQQILEAGTYAPSGHNRMGTWIVAVQNPEILEVLRRLNKEAWGERGLKIMGNTNKDPYYGSPTIVVVFADKDNPNNIKDGSVVMQNMMLAAHDIGLASCWINRADVMFETEEGKELIKRFGLEENLTGWPAWHWDMGASLRALRRKEKKIISG